MNAHCPIMIGLPIGQATVPISFSTSPPSFHLAAIARGKTDH